MKQISIKKIPGETNVADLGTKPLDPKRHQLLMQQLPLAPPTCRRFLAVLTALGVAPRAQAAQGFCATVCNASGTPTDYWSYFLVMFTIILIRVIDKFLGPKVAPVASTPAAAAPEAAEGRDNWQLVSEEEQVIPMTDDAETQTTPRETKDVRSQAPCTYTSVRGSNHPRFYPLPPHSHG